MMTMLPEVDPPESCSTTWFEKNIGACFIWKIDNVNEKKSRSLFQCCRIFLENYVKSKHVHVFVICPCNTFYNFCTMHTTLFIANDQSVIYIHNYTTMIILINILVICSFNIV